MIRSFRDQCLRRLRRRWGAIFLRKIAVGAWPLLAFGQVTPMYFQQEEGRGGA